MFKRIDGESTAEVSIMLDGERINVPADISVAAALLLRGEQHFRNSEIDSSFRAPYCMMGACFECLIEIDGRKNQRACQFNVTEGMNVRRQLAVPQSEDVK
ncbi:MAG: (2Fe-2S)-binding protein [Pseudomonadota bacterium]